MHKLCLMYKMVNKLTPSYLCGRRVGSEGSASDLGPSLRRRANTRNVSTALLPYVGIT